MASNPLFSVRAFPCLRLIVAHFKNLSSFSRNQSTDDLSNGKFNLGNEFGSSLVSLVTDRCFSRIARIFRALFVICHLLTFPRTKFFWTNFHHGIFYLLGYPKYAKIGGGREILTLITIPPSPHHPKKSTIPDPVAIE